MWSARWSFSAVCSLALGFLTRVVAAPIIGFLVIAIVTYHWQFGFAWENRGIEYPLFWSIVVLHFLVRGGGRVVARRADRPGIVMP